MKELSYYHPACIYMFFAAIFLFAVISRNPVFIVISFAGAIIYSSSVLGIQVILTEIKKNNRPKNGIIVFKIASLT